MDFTKIATSADLLATLGRKRRFESIDGDAIAATIQRALSSAGLNPESGVMKGVTATIRRALSSAGTSPAGFAGSTIDVDARTVPSGPEIEAPLRPEALDPARPGQFVRRSYSNAAGTRAYKLYLPKSYAADQALPLIVMLHGCTQNPDDFAAGTRMNELADRHGFLVVYPAQSANANGSNCWNWFQEHDQSRDRGEPSLIAGIARAVIGDYRVDKRRVYVAGLSAGAAMAVILGQTYPELFAAIGAHSGLAYGAAHDMPSAFAAMRGASDSLPGLANLGGARSRPAAQRLVPTIVFHGDRDLTVALGNGAEIVDQARAGASALHKAQQHAAAAGREYTRTVYSDARGIAQVEQWILHGAGHAWSGGSAAGSFTDATGPDASEEMIRFFLTPRTAA